MADGIDIGRESLARRERELAGARTDAASVRSALVALGELQRRKSEFEAENAPIGDEAITGFSDVLASLEQDAPLDERDITRILRDRQAVRGGLAAHLITRAFEERKARQKAGAADVKGQNSARSYKAGLDEGAFDETMDPAAFDRGADTTRAKHGQDLTQANREATAMRSQLNEAGYAVDPFNPEGKPIKTVARLNYEQRQEWHAEQRGRWGVEDERRKSLEEKGDLSAYVSTLNAQIDDVTNQIREGTVVTKDLIGNVTGKRPLQKEEDATLRLRLKGLEAERNAQAEKQKARTMDGGVNAPPPPPSNATGAERFSVLSDRIRRGEVLNEAEETEYENLLKGR